VEERKRGRGREERQRGGEERRGRGEEERRGREEGKRRRRGREEEEIGLSEPPGLVKPDIRGLGNTFSLFIAPGFPEPVFPVGENGGMEVERFIDGGM